MTRFLEMKLSSEQVREALSDYLNNVVLKEPVVIKKWSVEEGRYTNDDVVKIEIEQVHPVVPL